MSNFWIETGKLALIGFGCLVFDLAFFMKSASAPRASGRVPYSVRYLDCPWLGPWKILLLTVAIYLIQFLPEALKILAAPAIAGLFVWTEMHRHRLMSRRATPPKER